jgi:serpin B
MPQIQLAQSSIERNLNPQVSDADFAVVVTGNITFALTSFPLLDPKGATNTVFSPYSIAQVLALTAAGAKGNTLDEVNHALSFSLPQERLNPVLDRLSLLLSTETTVATSLSEQLPHLSISDAVWAQQGVPINKKYLDTLAANFGAGLQLLDFADQPEASRIDINAWVEHQTNGRIKELIASGGVSSATHIILTNTVWFKANWESKFNLESTSNQVFIGRTGASSSVPFMHETHAFPYTEIGGCQAIDLPYSGGKLSMLLIMPNAGSFDALLASFNAGMYSDIRSHLERKQLMLGLPKFTFNTILNLKSPLTALGMVDAFSKAKADFSGIDGQHDLFIDSVVHQAFIDVNENGTEASAATAVEMRPRFAVSKPIRLNIDHPFMFLLHDVQTGVILFMGKVVSL